MRTIKSVLTALFLFTAAGTAGAAESHAAAGPQEAYGLGLGALIGGLIAGPPGAIFGAAGGAWYGNREDRESARIVDLQNDLQDRQTRVAILEKQIDDIRREFSRELKTVKLEDRNAALSRLSRGISLAVYFRSDSTDIDEQMYARVRQLAGFMEDYPEIRLHLDAHADQRGSSDYNKGLSRRRAAAVEAALVAAGVDPERIRTFAYGESRADHPVEDREGMQFDRRVSITLSLDAQA